MFLGNGTVVFLFAGRGTLRLILVFLRTAASRATAASGDDEAPKAEEEDTGDDNHSERCAALGVGLAEAGSGSTGRLLFLDGGGGLGACNFRAAGREDALGKRRRKGFEMEAEEASEGFALDRFSQ